MKTWNHLTKDNFPSICSIKHAKTKIAQSLCCAKTSIYRSIVKWPSHLNLRWQKEQKARNAKGSVFSLGSIIILKRVTISLKRLKSVILRRRFLAGNGMERAFEDQECIEVSSSCVYSCSLVLKQENWSSNTKRFENL